METQTETPIVTDTPKELPKVETSQLMLQMQIMEKRAKQLAALRAPFEPSQISKLPKPYKKDAPKGNCKECGTYHGLPAAHLDYVGHAALTDRLLKIDPFWDWQPVAVDEYGQPLIQNGGMWIKLTVCGVTRLGYGDAQGKSGANAIKEIIGDALRNAAMRFGCALDLWHKGGDLNADEVIEQPSELPEISELKKCTTLDSLKKLFGTAWGKYTDPAQRAVLTEVYNQIKSNINDATQKGV